MACGCRKNKEAQQQQQAAALRESVTSNVIPETTASSIANDPSEQFKKDIALEPVEVPIEQRVESREERHIPPELLERIKQREAARQAAIIPTAQVKSSEQSTAVKEALENDLKSCYLCAKKHLVRAQILFEEYHTGYPDHIKNLVQSLRAAEIQVRGAFIRWQKVMGHLDMAANELLGNDINAVTMNKDHVMLANKIRDARIRLSDNPLASINFDDLILKVHLLQYKELEK